MTNSPLSKALQLASWLVGFFLLFKNPKTWPKNDESMMNKDDKKETLLQKSLSVKNIHTHTHTHTIGKEEILD